MKEFPLGVAWRTFVRRPYLCLIPLLWDLAKLALGSLLGPFGYYFSRWDFTVGWDLQGSGWYARFVMPPALPSVEQLGVALAPDTPIAPTVLQVAVMVLVLMVDSLVKGGFLYLLFGALRGTAPSLAKMCEGALLYGWRLFVLALVWMGYYVGTASLAEQGSFPQALLIPLHIVVIICLAVAELVVVAEDVWPPAAVLGAPLLLWQELGAMLAVVAGSGVLSGLLTAGASLLGLDRFLVLAPLYAATGTWLSLGALYAIASEPGAPEAVTAQIAGEAG